MDNTNAAFTEQRGVVFQLQCRRAVVTDAIIGATGFVGTNLCAQHDFSEQFHSRNISKIAGKAYDIVVCAAAPATMWAANKDPDGDLHNIHELLSHIERVDAERFVLIST